MVGNHRGFTFVELMAVVAIIGIIAGVAAFNAVELLPRYRLHAAARDFSGKLRLARKTAVRTASDVHVVFDQARNRYSVNGETVPYRGTLATHYGSGVGFGFGNATKSAAAGASPLPASPVTFQGNPRRVIFNPRGLSNAGTVYFTNSRRDCCAVVVSTSGRIRMRVWRGNRWE
jgi:prepilin-type N-terminal cleavage/methylation domain-containing protein